MKNLSQISPSNGSLLKATSLNVYYLAALVFLTLTAAVSYLGLRQINVQQDSNTILINVAGHQRALSVNIMLVSNLLVEEADSSKRMSLKKQLSDLITQMSAEHTHLINGTLPAGLSYPLSAEMKSLYFDESSALDRRVQEYLSWATELSTVPDTDLTTNHPIYVSMLAAWPDLLTALDNAVTLYGLEISARAAEARQQELVFLLACMGVGGLVTRYLFLSIQRNVQSDQLKLLSEIDNQRQAHQTLQRNETLYRLLARNLPNTGVLLFDQDLRYLVVEGAIMEQAGYPKETMEGKTFYEVLTPDAAHRLLPFYQAALAGHLTDFEFIGPQGLIYHIHSVPVKTDQGQLLGGMLTIHDITERKRAEETLREREHFIQRITATVPDIIYIFDVEEQRNIFTNREFGEVIGYSKEQIEQMGNQMLVNIMHPDDLVRFADQVKKLDQSAEGEALEIEYRMRSAKGDWRWFNSFDTVFARNENGAVTQILGVAHDIDRRKQTEEVLQRREHTIQQIAATVPDIIYIYDLELHSNVYANRPFGEAVGYDSDTIKAMGNDFMLKTMHPDDWPRFAEHFANLAQVADDTVLEFEYRMKTPQGTWCWLNSRDIVFTRDAEGHVAQILGVARDITEWKTAQDALRESEERFRQIAETVRSAFCIMSPDSRTTYYVSPAYETIWGHSLVDIYADPLAFTVAIHPEDRERVLRERKQHFSQGTYNVEYRIIRPDGVMRWINSRAYPVVNKDGVIERVISVSDDITERKEFEKQAFTIAVEREHIRVLSTFIQDTSHDLRTPLTVMTTSLYLLRKLTDPEKQAERIDQIEKQMNHLNRIIGDLHEMSKLDLVSQLQPDNMDLNRFVEDVSRAYVTSLSKKRIMLEIKRGADLPIILADVEQLKHALMNIIDNAMLYTEPGGAITISTACNEASVIIEVHDTGIGIAPEHHERIFDRFYKVDAARTSGRGGPGLGLSMVKRIVEIHGGEVEVKSTLGEGSSFRIYLPIASILDS
jgi:PAS domain S-box-containing protein